MLIIGQAGFEPKIGQTDRNTVSMGGKVEQSEEMGHAEDLHRAGWARRASSVGLQSQVKMVA